MKKIVSFLTLLVFIVSAGSSGVSAKQDDNYFIVTAYYSPLPDQEHYLTGNYEDELILNGKGIAGASGKKVFSGMLAAPGKYSFGTKIYLDGLGIGTVEDRGGAIVSAGQRGYSYDRIDVWMGFGEEGLKRSLFWGKRKVYGYVVDSANPVSLINTNIPSPSWATDSLKKSTAEVELLDIFNISLGKGSDSQAILELQDILIELSLLNADNSNGKYDTNTIDAIYNFQVSKDIVSLPSDVGAGFYGPKTRKTLEEFYNIFLEKQREEEQFLADIALAQQESFILAEKQMNILERPIYGEVSSRVRELQKTLTQLGFFNYKDTAIFGDKTKQALVEYQLSNNIILNDIESGAGYFGPKTRGQFTKDLSNLYFQDILEKRNITEKYQQYILETNSL